MDEIDEGQAEFDRRVDEYIAKGMHYATAIKKVLDENLAANDRKYEAKQRILEETKRQLDLRQGPKAILLLLIENKDKLESILRAKKAIKMKCYHEICEIDQVEESKWFIACERDISLEQAKTLLASINYENYSEEEIEVIFDDDQPFDIRIPL